MSKKDFPGKNYPVRSTDCQYVETTQFLCRFYAQFGTDVLQVRLNKPGDSVYVQCNQRNVTIPASAFVEEFKTFVEHLYDCHLSR